MKQWEQEPDEKKWAYKSYDCKIIRHPRLGHLCGYVRIPEGHPLFNKKYNDQIAENLNWKKEEVLKGEIGKRGIIETFCVALGPEKMNYGFLFDVHGGVTFSGKLKDEDGFWYGFDCAHCDDLTPYTSYSYGESKGIYRDMEYVTKETESLVDQLMSLMEAL